MGRRMAGSDDHVPILSSAFLAALQSGGLRFVRLVPRRTTPHSRLLNMETLVVALLTGADFLVASQLIGADAAWRPKPMLWL